MKYILLVIASFSFHILLAQNHWVVDSIPVRDGKKIAADVYLPDTSGGQTFPAILIQTPYNRMFYRYALPLGFGTQIQNSPYAFVITDWRCFYGSASACVTNTDRGKDGYDVVEWIASQLWSDQKIGTWGPSALGEIQYLTAKEKPPHLTCAIPLVAAPQYNYQDYYQGGDLRKEYVETLDALGFGLSPIIMAHKVYDYFWQYAENASFYPIQIEVPVLMIGGWYDHNTNNIIDFYKGLKQSSPLIVRNKHKLLMGPWAHGGFSTAQVGTSQQGQLFYPEAAGWSDSIALLFFDHYMRNINNGWDSISDYLYFQMGENIWNYSNAFPPQNATFYNFYLHSDLTLSNTAPTDLNTTVHINYNPKNPSPTVGGATLTQSLGQGPFDQSPVVESRNDIAVFTSQALVNPVVLKGKASVVLNISSNTLDTDFAIRLTDVYPDGRSMLLIEGIKRLRFRNGYWANDTVVMQPGNIYQITIDLPYLAHTFLAGHKIRLDVSSSNYPRFDINLNNGGAMYVAGDTIVAYNSIQVNSNFNSYVKLPLIDFASGIEKNINSPLFYCNIFPNPASDFLNIELEKNDYSSKYNIEITDVFGRVIKNYNLNLKEADVHTFLVSICPFSKGIYFIKISNEKNQIYVKKILKI